MEAILGFLSSLLGVSAPFVVVLVPILVIIVLYTMITGKPFSMELAGKTFSFGGKTKKDAVQEQENDTEQVQTCSNCPKKELYIEKAKGIVKVCTEHTTEIKRDIILQQMNYAEEKIEELRILLCKNYSKRLSNILNCSVIKAKEHKDYKLYRLVVYHILLQKIKDGVIKKALKENHFLEMSDAEFSQYKNRKQELIIEKISEWLDTLYSDDTLISREELFNINENIKHDTLAIIRTIFDNAKHISATYNDKINECVAETERKLYEI